MENVVCDFCVSEDSEVLLKQKDIVYRNANPEETFYLHKCNNCGLIYLNPRPSQNELDKYYPAEYECHSGRTIIFYRLREILTRLISTPYINQLVALCCYLPFLQKRFNKLVQPETNDYIKGVEPRKMLDVGCGSALNTHHFGYKSSLYHLKKKGFEVYGMEPILRARQIAAQNGIKMYASFKEIEGQSFDLIRMNWSLEHVDSPSKTFETIYKLLRPGGKLIIAVPNYDGIIYRLYSDCVELPVHFYYFTPKTLEAYLKKYNFDIIDSYTFSYPSMFVFSTEILGKQPPLKLTPLQSIHFQKTLNYFDTQKLGNDIVYLCEKASSNTVTTEFK